jgi:hypothetical protein
MLQILTNYVFVECLNEKQAFFLHNYLVTTGDSLVQHMPKNVLDLFSWQLTAKRRLAISRMIKKIIYYQKPFNFLRPQNMSAANFQTLNLIKITP